MTTSPVMTVTDEMLAELDRSVRVVWPDDYPAVIAAGALTGELRRLRAENAELAQSLAESRANDQAAMGWLTSLRWASGDRGERMLPELVTHIEEIKRDAERYRWMRDDAVNAEGDTVMAAKLDGLGNTISNWMFGRFLDESIDAAMQATK